MICLSMLSDVVVCRLVVWLDLKEDMLCMSVRDEDIVLFLGCCVVLCRG